MGEKREIHQTVTDVPKKGEVRDGGRFGTVKVTKVEKTSTGANIVVRPVPTENKN